MKHKVLIIDDEQPARSLILNYLNSNDSIEVIAECSNGFDGFKKIEELKPDIVFLDIQMPKLTGFEMLELIENPPIIIFTTAFDQFAIKAFEVNAIDYLLKPFSKERFEQALQKSIEKLSSGHAEAASKNYYELKSESEDFTDRIVVKKNQKIEILPTNSIIHIQAEDDYVMIHSEKGKYLKNSTMNFLEKTLNPDEFLRVHRSNIINVNHIDKIEKYDKETHLILLKNHDKIKTSKSGSKLLRQLLGI